MFQKIKSFFHQNASELLRAGMVSLLIAGTVFCAVLTIFLGNISDFSFTLSEIIGPLLGGTFLLFFFLFVAQAVFCFAGEKVFSSVNLLFLLGAVYLYLQANFLVWNIGTMMGEEFWWDKNEHGTYTLIEILCMAVLLITFFVWRKWLYKYAALLSGFLLLLASTGAISVMLSSTSDSEFSYKNYIIDRTDEFRFGKERNVILLILDAYPNVLLDTVEEKYPGSLAPFHDFTRYEKCLCEAPGTSHGMTAILAGIQLSRDPKEYARAISKCYYTHSILKFRKSFIKICTI
ncbi:MAG: hypothetical protein Q4C96_11130, partial [Planctomycetia bacterium]|nr:hypothetical protein [Planctomycetia bacterium]